MVAKVVPQGEEDKAFLLGDKECLDDMGGYKLLGEKEKKQLEGIWRIAVVGREYGFWLSTRGTHVDPELRVSVNGISPGKEGWSISDELKEPEDDRPYWEMEEGTRIEPITPVEATIFRKQKER